jgi:hypothetical protein
MPDLNTHPAPSHDPYGDGLDHVQPYDHGDTPVATLVVIAGVALVLLYALLVRQGVL